MCTNLDRDVGWLHGKARCDCGTDWHIGEVQSKQVAIAGKKMQQCGLQLGFDN